jgi:3-phenylpropionate/trans-cinnamate dioxygenase ferredoxin subunit
VALAKCDGGLHAVLDNCSHEDYPLSEGEVFADVCEIECLRHGSTFSLLDGAPQSLPATRPITVLDLEIVDGDVFVELP